MLTRQRKNYLLERLARDGRLVAATLSEELGLSEDTIRRDLRELARDGVLQRVHGGALPASPAMGDFTARLDVAPADKGAIGRAAAQLVQPGQVVFIDGGTTCAQLVHHLPAGLRATVVTHSPSIAMELVAHPTLEVVILGGRLFRHSIVNVGAATLAAIAQIRADIYFMGVCSVHPEAGLSTGDFEEACVKRALCAQAAETIVLASPEKLGAASPFVVAAASEMSVLLTTNVVPEPDLSAYGRLGVAVVRTPV